MHLTSTIAAGALFAASALAQSPPNYKPGTILPLGVNYGNTYLSPNESLPQSLVDTLSPSAYSPGIFANKYQLLLVDLVIPDAFVPGDNLVPGLGVNRTTRLHWWQTNVTHASTNGSFLTGATPALAPYAGPMPPAGDIFHTYVFYLFNQPKSFVPPAAALAGEFQDPNTDARFNFSLSALAAQVGNPVLANYMRIENSANAGAPTSAPTGGPGAIIAKIP